MTTDDLMELARAMEKVPGLKGIEMRDVRRLAQLLKDQPEIGSIELKGFFGTGVVITRTQQGGPVASAPASWPAGASTAPPAAPAAAPAVAEAAAPAVALKEIKSPMVGTYYAQPEPGAEPYARIGTRVSAGQTVCIIEAMKIMNEIEAEISGVIREVCVEDASPVEYGQVLYRVDPNG